MIKRAVVLVFALALMLLISVPCAASASAEALTSVTPENLLATTADLSKSGSDLYLYVRFLFISPETTYFNVALQQYSGGEWSTWSSYSDVRYEQAFIFTKYLAPPKGYCYRIKVVGSSISFPGFEFYSGEVYY